MYIVYPRPTDSHTWIPPTIGLHLAWARRKKTSISEGQECNRQQTLPEPMPCRSLNKPRLLPASSMEKCPVLGTEWGWLARLTIIV